MRPMYGGRLGQAKFFEDNVDCNGASNRDYDMAAGVDKCSCIFVFA